MHIFLPILLIFSILICATPVPVERQNNFYMSRFNSVILTFFVGSFSIGLFFALITRSPLYYAVSQEVSAASQFEKSKISWDKVVLNMCFFLNCLTSSYLTMMQILRSYEDNIRLRRVESLRKRIWVFQRVEILAFIAGILIGIFGSISPRHIVQTTAFLTNVMVIIDIITVKRLKTILIAKAIAISLTIFWIFSSLAKFNHIGSLVTETLVNSPYYIGLLRLRPFVGSDYITMGMIDFFIPGMIYKFMTMMDCKREQWLMENRLILHSNHPSYAKITIWALIATSVFFVAFTGISVSEPPFLIIFTVIQILLFGFNFWFYNDLDHFLLFSNKLDEQIPNIEDQPLLPATTEMQNIAPVELGHPAQNQNNHLQALIDHSHDHQVNA